MSDKESDWEYQPSGMMRVYQGMKYNLGQSIADLVDNGIDEGAKTVDIQINIGSGNKIFIAIYDDGLGIPGDKLDSAMGLGSSSKGNETKLGVFGIGLKLSSLAQADEVTIESSFNRSPYNLRRISAPYIIQKNENKLLKYPLMESENEFSESYNKAKLYMIKNKFSTMVLLENLHSSKRFLTVNKRLDCGFRRLQEPHSNPRVHLNLFATS